VLLQLCALLSLASAADFYKLLGISRDATLKEIKKAYRQKSLEFHPDKNKDESASEKFAEIARAYEVLSDESLKEVYDRHGEEGLKQHEQRGGGDGGGFGGFEDIFSQFGFNFHSSRRQQGEQQTESVEIPLYVTLKQLYLGDTMEVEYIREVLCVNWKECMKDAQECQGPGLRVRMQQLAPGFVQQVQQRDDRCISRGKMWRPNCRECPNKTETEKINLTIELTPGMRPGERVTFEGVTDEKPGYTAGDLHFLIVEQPDATFHRDKDDLYKTMEIPLVDALVSCFVVSGKVGYVSARVTHNCVSSPFHF
jgi:DnaJ-class molecular chaperone